MASKFTRRAALVAGAGVATAACAQDIETPPYEGAVAFNHGVASGDPKHDKVIIWTRVTPERAGPVPVRWIVARNRELTDVVKTGVTNATEARDYCVKVDVTNLRQGAPYFYGFRAGAAQSMVGKTRTLTRGRQNQLKMVVTSCASYPHGFFNAYQAIGARDDIDVVVHLGDYIYEYGLSGYGGDTATQLGRVPSPEVECVRLQDYRQRHAQAKAEAELQAAHAIAPWIVVWDDHEVANDSWSGGAENHQPNEGNFADRKRASLQAYYEWMPIREPEAGRAFESINRSFQFGDLLTLCMLETRLLARTKQLDYATDMPIEQQRWDFANPNAPVAIRPTEEDRPTQRLLPAIYEAIGGAMTPVLDWRRAGPMIAAAPNLPAGFFFAPDARELAERLAEPERALLGPAQEQWLATELGASKQANVKWRIIGSQVVMAPITAPDLSHTPPPLAAAIERLRPGVTQLLKLTRFPLPLNTDSWDGYPEARKRVLQAIRASGGDTMVIAGDSHTAWANEINDENGRVAVEFGATSITSPSDASFFTAAGIDFSAGVRARNPHIKFTEANHRGFTVLTLTKDNVTAEYMAVSTITTKQFETTTLATFTVAPAGGGSIGPLTAVT
ncbi:alkaline phosphatase D family protein [Terricaulis sp.]|uniref:alkaline phosphatase D family protein n=1 Tax=Terricaulis sp. TaxID=2768686 RepID=UPI003785208A